MTEGWGWPYPFLLNEHGKPKIDVTEDKRLEYGRYQ